MSCDIFQQTLLTLPVEQFGELQSHLSHCDDCRAMANQLRHDEEALEEGIVASMPALSFESAWEQAELQPEQPIVRAGSSLRWMALAAVALLAVGAAANQFAAPDLPAAPEVAGVEFDEQILELEEQQHTLEHRWSALEAQRSRLEAEQGLARSHARAAAKTAEVQRVALESGGLERDWHNWLAAERRAKAEADRAGRADFAVAEIRRDLD